VRKLAEATCVPFDDVEQYDRNVSGDLHRQCRTIRWDLSKDNRDGTESYLVAISKRGAPVDSLPPQVGPVLTS
jgi:hypothetical protein